MSRDRARQTERQRVAALCGALVGRLQTMDATARQHLEPLLVCRISVAPDRTVRVEDNF